METIMGVVVVLCLAIIVFGVLIVGLTKRIEELERNSVRFRRPNCKTTIISRI